MFSMMVSRLLVGHMTIWSRCGILRLHSVFIHCRDIRIEFTRCRLVSSFGVVMHVGECCVIV